MDVTVQDPHTSDTLIKFLADCIMGFVVFLVILTLLVIIVSQVLVTLANQGTIGSSEYSYIGDAGILLCLSVSIAIYLRAYKRIKAFDIPAAIGANLSMISIRTIGLGLIIFSMIICIELIVALISALTNVQISSNVAQTIGNAPAWFYIFSATIEPINEEVAFRGFLLPRLKYFFGGILKNLPELAQFNGTMAIVLSAAIFGALHASYNSTFGIEVIAAFIFGIISGFVYDRTGSLYPGIIAHIFVNSIAVIGILGS